MTTRAHPTTIHPARSPRRRARRLAVAVTGVLLAGMPLAGCGDDDPERRLEEMSENMNEVEEDVAEAREDVAERRRGVTDAEKRLETAQEELRRAKQRLADLETRVDRRATDVAVFRLVQSRLLDDEALHDSAVMASVTDGVVELHGTVSSEDERQRAVSVAKSVPGVDQVRQSLQLESEDGERKTGSEARPRPDRDA